MSLTANLRTISGRMFFDVGLGVGAFRSDEVKQEAYTARLYWHRTESLTPDLNLALGVEL